ncbi:proteasome maturation protein-like [Hylaeus volcanicus]|uniref:proteasome maturation protein-like n=1 Tax=Hylaeus volcanicus TaxID=313075 RepID=UPI0023B7F0C3|nr:proteasome maturation protein-like [Hylaeus volcanicus]
MALQCIPEKYNLIKRTDTTVDTSIQNGKINPSALVDHVNHPIGELQRKGIFDEETQYLRSLSSIYGLHAPLTLARERTFVAQTRRLPPFRSSLLGLHLAMSTEDTITFEDYLNIEIPNAPESRQTIASLMEKRLNFNSI